MVLIILTKEEKKICNATDYMDCLTVLKSTYGLMTDSTAKGVSQEAMEEYWIEIFSIMNTSGDQTKDGVPTFRHIDDVYVTDIKRVYRID